MANPTGVPLRQMITVPSSFSESTLAREGPAGGAWIKAIPDLVRDLCHQWRLVIDGPPMHGYLALRAWGGCGAVKLFDAQEGTGAMLLERLNPDRTLEHAASDEAVTVAGNMLRRLSVLAPPNLRTVGQEIADFRSALPAQWKATGRPFPKRLLEMILEFTAVPASPSPPLIVNQDLHYGNVLEGSREPWLVIDPKPLAGDPEFGVAQLLWTRFDELTDRISLERRFDILVETAELDADLAHAWSMVRVVEYWLWALGEGFTEDPEKCRYLLEWLAPQFAS